jgi:hypothetical protein
VREALILVVVLLMLPGLAWGCRDRDERNAFARENPCPETGKGYGRCPGWVVDHVIPLCAGGPDKRDNMQWQTVEDAKAKDRVERQLCRP